MQFIDLVFTLSREFALTSTDSQPDPLTTVVQKNTEDEVPEQNGQSANENPKLKTDTANKSTQDVQTPDNGAALNSSPDEVRSIEDRQELTRKHALRLIAEDYMASLNADILDAKIDLMENSASLMSLQRLAGKGLASRPQLELQKIRQQAAEARYDRLKKQQAGLRELFPNLFPSPLPPPRDDPEPVSQEKQKADDS
jgi:hypothetical protein